MKAKRIYRVILENESRLENVRSWRLTPLRLILYIAGALAVALLLAGTLICVTPIRNILPGYMKDTERAATVENLLRLDSLNEAFGKNKAFLNNLLTVLDTDREPSDSLDATRPASRLTSDSLLPASREEEKFVRMMQERERYNISVIAPLASEGMIFYPVSKESIFLAETRNSFEPAIALAEGQPVGSVADGLVISVIPGGLREEGYTVIIQHGKGFLSSYSRLSLPTVEPGEWVEGGQTIAIQQNGQGIRSAVVKLKMWHNGTPLRPYDYIGSTDRPPRDATQYEAPRGR